MKSSGSAALGLGQLTHHPSPDELLGAWAWGPLSHSPTRPLCAVTHRGPHLHSGWVSLASPYQCCKHQMIQCSHKWQLDVYIVLQHITSEFSSLSKELLLIFQRFFSIHMKTGGLRKRKVIDCTSNYLHQQKLRDIQSADFVFILVTEQEEER